MRKIREILFRSVMLFLVVAPAAVLIAYFAHMSYAMYLTALLAMILLVGFASVCPSFVGNYKVEESVVTVSKSTSDPNPDKEFEHVVNKSGVRFPLRAIVLVILIILMPAGYIAVFSPYITGGWAELIVPALVLFALSLLAASDFVRRDSMFTDVQGILIGAIIHFLSAVFFHFIKRYDLTPSYVGGAFTSVFLVVSVLMLNHRSILMSVNSDTQRAPAKIRRKNTVIVLCVTAFVFALSFAEKIKEGAEWLFNKLAHYFWIVFMWLTELMSTGTPSGDSGGGGGDMSMLQELAGEEESKPTPKFVEYILIGIAAAAMLALLWLLIRQLVKLAKRIFESLNTSEGVTGYVDETEEIRPEERENSAFGSRIRELLTPEKPWARLNGRERVRRVMQRVLRRSGEDVSCMTAREARAHVDLKQADGDELFGIYDEARYSSHEISSEKADELKKAAKV